MGMRMPSWMLAAPGMALWPPPLIANLHSFSVKSATARETFSAVSGKKMHWGLRNSVAAVLISKVVYPKTRARETLHQKLWFS